MLYFNVILVINNDTLTNVSADFWLQSILQELQTQSMKSEWRDCFMFETQ